MNPLDLLVEQLWGPGLDDTTGDRPRVVLHPAPDPHWRDVERYHVLPDPTRARLLVPVAAPAVVRAATTHYRGLRPLPANVARGLLGIAASARLPLSRHHLAVRVRADHTGHAAAAALPLATIARELGQPRLHATFGVRTGANRKATLHLLADDGTTVGYAKLGWNDTADTYVRTETEALGAVGGRVGAMRAPGVLASFAQGGRPVVVVEPLPADVRGLRGRQQDPTPAEMYALAPVVRSDVVRSTGHFRALRERLAQFSPDATVTHVAAAAAELADLVAADAREVPVQARWHGDLSPWNCARQPGGQLWAWDWESSEPDAVAGLDAVHWHFSVAREDGRLATVTLAECLELARPHLTAAGWSSTTQPVVAAVYALTVVERAAALAARESGWERVWIRPERLDALMAEARSLLGVDHA